LATSTDIQATPADTKATAPGHKAPNGNTKHSNVNYPNQLRLSITDEMAASLARVARYREIPEGIICREVLKQYLLQNDPQYRADISLIARNQSHG
jgi:hypothetical protein